MAETPKPIIKASVILKELKEKTGDQWVIFPGEKFGVSAPKINSDDVMDFLNSERGLLFVTFVNVRTSELRFFAAKAVELDV